MPEACPGATQSQEFSVSGSHAPLNHQNVPTCGCAKTLLSAVILLIGSFRSSDLVSKMLCSCYFQQKWFVMRHHSSSCREHGMEPTCSDLGPELPCSLFSVLLIEAMSPQKQEIGTPSYFEKAHASASSNTLWRSWDRLPHCRSMQPLPCWWITALNDIYLHSLYRVS